MKKHLREIAMILVFVLTLSMMQATAWTEVAQAAATKLAEIDLKVGYLLEGVCGNSILIQEDVYYEPVSKQKFKYSGNVIKGINLTNVETGKTVKAQIKDEQVYLQNTPLRWKPYCLVQVDGSKITVLPESYADVIMANSRSMFLQDFNGKYGAIDSSGKVVVDFVYDEIRSAEDYYYDTYGSLTSTSERSDVWKSIVTKEKEYINGKNYIYYVVNGAKYSAVYDFVGEYAIANVYNETDDVSQSRWVVLDTQGNIVLEESDTLDFVEHNVINGMLKVRTYEDDDEKGQIGWMDIKTKKIVHEEDVSFINGYALTAGDMKIIDENWNDVTPEEKGNYKYSNVSSSGFVWGKIDDTKLVVWNYKGLTTGTQMETSSQDNTASADDGSYIYDTTDPGENVELGTAILNKVTDKKSAIEAVKEQLEKMSDVEKASPTGIDLITLYAEAAIAKAASKEVDKDILINKAEVADLEKVAKETKEAVASALIEGGVSTARYIANTVSLATDSTDEISIRIDPDILTTDVDKIYVEAPTYAITLKVEDLRPDLTEIIEIKMKDVGSGFAPGRNSEKTTVSVNLPKGKTSNPVTITLPADKGDETYQAVVNTEGQATASKYNPVHEAIDGKITTSGSYTVQTNQKDFSDIANKSAEMQNAIKYLASKGIISGTSAEQFSPDSSISRAEIAALMMRALGKLDSSATANFTDVNASNWYYTAAGSSQKTGLISGYEDNTFRGLNQINKEQIVAVSGRVLTSEMGYTKPENSSLYISKYTDGVVDWAQSDVALATKENLVVYRTDGTFKGANGMTRGDAAIIIYRLFQRIW